MQDVETIAQKGNGTNSIESNMIPASKKDSSGDWTFSFYSGIIGLLSYARTETRAVGYILLAGAGAVILTNVYYNFIKNPHKI